MPLVIPGASWCLGKLTEEKAHAQTHKDLKHKEIWHTKEGRDSSSNMLAAGMGFP